MEARAAQISGATGRVIDEAAAPALNGIDPNLIEMESDGIDPSLIEMEPNAPWSPAEWSPTGLLDQGVAQVAPQTVGGHLSAIADSPLDPKDDPWAQSLQGQDLGGMPSPKEPTDEQLAIELANDPTKAALYEQKMLRDQAAWKAEQEGIARRRDEFQREQAHRSLLEVHAKTQGDMDQLGRDIKALANTKIIRDRRSGTSRVLDALLGGLGGLVSARTGGPNVGLQMVMKSIDDDVEIQKAELTNKQHALGMQKGFIEGRHNREMEVFKATEAYRIASYDRAIADITTQANQFDPKGTQAIAFAKTIQGLAAQKQAAEAAAIDRFYKINKADADLQHQMLVNAGLKNKLGIGAGGAGGAVVPPTAVNEADFKSVIAPSWFKGTPKQWLDTRNAYLEGKSKETSISKVAQDQEDTRNEKIIHGFVDTKGKPLMAGDKERAKEVMNEITAATLAINIIDEIDSIREVSGGASKWVNSPEWQRLQVLDANLLKVTKGGTQGMSSDEDMKILKKASGSEDATTFRAMGAALKKARENTINAINNKISGQGGMGGAPNQFNPRNNFTGKPVETAADRDKKTREKLEKVANNPQMPDNVRQAAHQNLTVGAVGELPVAPGEETDPKWRVQPKGVRETAPPDPEAKVPK